MTRKHKIESTRMFLREFSLSDRQAMQGVFCDPEVMQYSESGVHSPEWITEWVKRCQGNYQSERGYGLWAVVRKDDNGVLGYCGLTYFPDIGGSPEVEIGYRLIRSCWGKGYATEAAKAVLRYAFDSLALNRLIALIDPNNLASIRVAEKLGMKYEKDYCGEGYAYPDLVYMIERQD